ncbi:hypothetical protein [Salinisphaera sp.]|uniref:hypothetical protein n=1 Tax=Salinisphaera sp. TaxID=1914330 RepID=UPI002D76777A|nr:hypothetical protein [Salinisphaera sp.]HET7312961.1 hypothetical protein [Salinisphaera sp.]
MAVASSSGVTLGYLVAAGLTAGLWTGVGLILLPVMLLLAALHALAAAGGVDCPGSHHRWLAAHYLLSVIALCLVLLAPLAALPALLTDTMTVINTLLYAPHPIATLAAAWPALGHWPTLIGAGLVFFFGWFAVMLWISLRLLRRGLRWAEGAPAY